MAKFLTQRRKSNILSVLFDLDGTLVDSIGVHTDSHFEVLKSVGAVEQRHQVEQSWANVNWNTDTLYESFGAELGIDPMVLVSAHVDDMHSRYESHLFSPLPGAKTVLELLRESGLSVAVVTSSSESLARIALETAKLDGYVDELVSRERTDVHKPNPEPYSYGLQKLGVSPAQAVAFEDSWDGLKSAVDAGIFTFYLGREAIETDYKVDLYERIDSLTKLI